MGLTNDWRQDPASINEPYLLTICCHIAFLWADVLASTILYSRTNSFNGDNILVYWKRRKTEQPVPCTPYWPIFLQLYQAGGNCHRARNFLFYKLHVPPLRRQQSFSIFETLWAEAQDIHKNFGLTFILMQHNGQINSQHSSKIRWFSAPSLRY